VALASDLHAHLPSAALRIVAAITHLGDLWTVAAASTVVLAILLLRRHVRLATCWALAVAGIVPINSGIKAWFQRPRPLHGQGFLTESGWSFPSGHAFGAIVFYGMLAYVLLRLLPLRWHRPVVAGAIAMVTVIGISRVLLQVHYLSDVIGGYASGLAWLVVCIGGAEYWRLRRTV
jgi:membrane-associated phospholipid phosphatase